jgi:Spy/CpxP family protein refolding chaperone
MARALIVVTSLAFALAAPLAAGHAQQVRTTSSLLGREPTPIPNVDSIVFHGIERTPAQRDSIESIRSEFRSRVEKLNGERRADYRDRFLDLREWQIAAMRRVLTPEQQKIFDETSEFWRESDAKVTRQRDAQRDSLSRLRQP